MASFSDLIAMHSEARMVIALSLGASDLAKCQNSDSSTSQAFADGAYWQACVEQESTSLIVDPALYSASRRKTVMSCFQLLHHVSLASGTKIRLTTHEDAVRTVKTMAEAKRAATSHRALGGGFAQVCVGSFTLQEKSLGAEAIFPFRLSEAQGEPEGTLHMRLGSNGTRLLMETKYFTEAAGSVEQARASKVRLHANVASVASHSTLRYRDVPVHLNGEVQSCANGIWASMQRGRASETATEVVCVVCIKDGEAQAPSAALAHSLHLDRVKRRQVV
eukprot:TRINITY_DN15411_c0_g1_i1.p1 TRINITY_DN15411_c0_g1~~TRINITY_DN15411_c0_g1_i1.p1  ORF type:complete len:277 (+),score=42.72 TRINITY_DN15411_c0_g1_i1:65-895(+)